MAGKRDKVSVGRLRYLADLQKATITSDGGGGNAETFSTIAKIFIDIRPVSGDEKDRQGKVQGQTTHKIHTRYRKDMQIDYRISYQDRLFQIQNILNIDERNRWYELSVIEGVAR